jgi:hypothetical protein
MCVLIVDIDKIDFETASTFVNMAAEVIKDDVIVLPKGIDILQDVPIEWLKHLRDQLDEKIKALESDVN